MNRKLCNLALESNDWTDSEKKILEWQMDSLGGFFTKLIDVMCHADQNNMVKLSRGYPSLSAAVFNWRYGDLHERFQKAGLMS